MKKKYGLFKVLTIILLLVVVATYFLEGRNNSIQYLALGDVISNYVQSFYYFFDTAIFILVVGGFYGFLNRIPAYKKLVEKIADKVSGKSMAFVIISTILFAVLSSVTGFNLLMLLFIPFVVSIILLLGYDKLVAMSATIGGTLVGIMGGVFFTVMDPNTYVYGTYDLFVGLKSNWVNVFPRVLLLVITTGLLVFYIISHVKKVNDGKVKYKLTKSDNFYVEVKDRSGKVVQYDKDKISTIPLIIILALFIVILVLGYFPWNGLFGIECFNEFHTLLTSFTFADAKYLIMVIMTLLIIYSIYKLVKLGKDGALFSSKSLVWFIVLTLEALILGVFAIYSFELATSIGKKIIAATFWKSSVFTTLFSSTITAFGTWKDSGNFIVSIFVSIIMMLILMVIYRIKFEDAMDGFILGVKKMLHPVMIAMFAYCVLVCSYNNGFMENVITMASEKFGDNVVLHSLISMLGSVLNVDIYYISIGIFSPIVTNLTESANLSIYAVMFQSVYGLIQFFGPTSILLIIGLSYLDVPYKTWLKYIWRFVLELIIVVLLVLMLVSLL